MAATLLRDLLFGYEEGTSLVPADFSVFNTSTQSTSNGGQCCLWTVPTGVTHAIFEMWSGGGSGGGGNCCRHGGGAGAGGYGVKSCNVVAGQQIRICAASSGCCSASGQPSGLCGCCTFVCSLDNGTWLANICGGVCANVETRCFYYSNCYDCCSQCYCCGGIGNNVDFFFPGVNGGAHPTQHCVNDGYQVSANAPNTAGGMRMGYGGCCAVGGGNGFGMFPGGGGLSSQTMGGGCCCGSPGGGGMVYVVYY